MNLFSPAEFTANYAQAGAAKARMPLAKMLFLAILAVSYTHLTLPTKA